MMLASSLSKVTSRSSSNNPTSVAFHRYVLANYIGKCITPGRRQSKTPILSRNVDKKSLETVFLIVICRQTWQQMEIKNTVSIDFWSAFVDF